MTTITSCTRDCPDTCSLLVDLGPGGEVSLKGHPDHPVTAGFICAKTRRFAKMLRSPHRITTPRLKVAGEWHPIDWPAALQLCAEKISLYRREPASILHIFDLGDKGLMPLVANRFFSELGASRVGGSLCDSAGIAGCIADFGALDHNDILDLTTASRIVNWGKDLSRSSVHMAMLVRQARAHGAEVVTISPGGDGNRTYTDHQVRIRPGTDRFLAAALIGLLIERDRIAPDALAHATGWPAFHALVLSRSVAELSATCGIAPEELELIYRFYTHGQTTATIVGYGLQRYRYGAENVRFINALALLSGHIGRSGGGSYFNISSVRNFNLGWTNAPGEAQRRTLWISSIGREILAAKDPPIKMIWVNGCNVVNQAPDSRATARAFAAADFKVVVDAFMNDTAARADLILPCTLMLEREEVIGSFMHNYVQYAAPALAPPERARDDHWILSEVGRRLDPPVLLPGPETCFRAALDSPYLSVSLEELRLKGFVRADRPQVAFAGLQFAHPDGKYRFPPALHDEAASSSEYPLRFLTLVRREAMHSQMLPEDHDSLPTVWVAEDGPALGRVSVSQPVFVASPLGRLQVRVETLPDLHPEVCLYRRDDWMMLGGGSNQLIEGGSTDLGEGTPFYQQYVRLEN
jgi:anaerobic selenocysteine-containing dehydrogenase